MPTLALLLFTLLSAVPGSETKPLVLTHVTLIDMTGSPPSADTTVVITGDRISNIGKSGAVRIPKDATVIDASGKFLIPGLWDMHVHLSLATRSSLSVLVANGITGVRDMGGDLTEIDRFRDAIANRSLVGPHIYRAGPVVDGPKEAEYRLTITTPSEARQAVLRLKAQQVDFIKVHNAIPRDAYVALMDEAQKQGLTVSGHIPAGMTAAEVSDMGQRTIEHTESLMEFPMAQAAKHTKEPKEIFAETVDAYDDAHAQELFQRFKRNGTWFVPTLVEYRSFAYRADLVKEPDPRNKYVPSSLRKYWENTFPVRGGPEAYAARKMMLAKLETLVVQMYKQGVPLMTGSDLGARDIYPGFSLHDELALLVDAGLTPMAALQAATVMPAKFLGKEDLYGTIKIGKIADLVLLDANPLDSISNTQTIRAVIMNGSYVGRDELDKMLDVAATATR